MFPCACSLRSTQCAALIALAAAAGIMRIEPARTQGTPRSEPEPQRAISPLDASVSNQMGHFQFVAAAAPWVHLFQIASEWVAAAEVRAPFSLSPPLAERELLAFDFRTIGPSAREHSFPYAVGPPKSDS